MFKPTGCLLALAIALALWLALFGMIWMQATIWKWVHQ